MTDTASTITVPGYRAGTWVLDPAHSEVGFSVRHMMISKVRGAFNIKSATLVAPENPLEATVEATVDVTSLDTKDEGRDGHLRSGRLLRRRELPDDRVPLDRRTRRGRGLPCRRRPHDPRHHEACHLRLRLRRLRRRPVGQLQGRCDRQPGVTTREDFGLTWNAALETGGVLVGKDVTITLDLQGALQQD